MASPFHTGHQGDRNAAYAGSSEADKPLLPQQAGRASPPSPSAASMGVASPLEALYTHTVGNKSGVGWMFVTRWTRLAKIGFGSLTSAMCGSALFILLASGANAYLSYYSTQLSGPMLLALVEADASQFTKILWKSLAVVVVLVGLSTVTAYLSERMHLTWRRRLVRVLHQRYFHGRLAYWLNSIDGSVDNIDQRVTQDVEQFTVQSTDVLFGSYPIAVATASTATGASLCSSITSIGITSYFIASQVDPKAVGALFGYVAICILVTQFIVRPISRATFALNAAEGTFRFVWAHIKEFAEVICLYNGQRDEEARADAAFDRMYFKFFRLYGWQMLLNFVSFFTSYAATSMCFLVIAYIIHTDGSIEGQPINTATVNSSVSAFQIMTISLMDLPSIYSKLGSLAGLTHRVGQLVEALDQIEATQAKVQTAALSDAHPHAAIHIDSTVEAVELGFRLPTGVLLFDNISFTVERFEHLMIAGPSGSGKSSLLRMLAGLWPVTDGAVYLPLNIGRAGSFFLPQRPFIAVGTLRDQILYPDRAASQDCGDEELVGILKQLQLAYLLSMEGGLDAVQRWDDILSPGEQQRLQFARLLYHKPMFAFMDESTSALQVPLEARCMRLAQQAGVTCISVAHRPTLVRFHTRVLTLDGNGGMNIEDVDPQADEQGRAYTRAPMPGILMWSAADGTSIPSSLVSRPSADTETLRRLLLQDRTSDWGDASVDDIEEEKQELVRTVMTEDGAAFRHNEMEDTRKLGLNMRFFKRLLHLMRLTAPRARSLMTLCGSLAISCIGVTAYVQIEMAAINGPFTGALVAQDGALLRATTIWAGELLLVGSLGASLLRLCCSVMVVEWYTRMVSLLHRRVFRGKLLYGANCMTEGLDNVDQRVVMDTRALANDTITFLASALSLFANVASAVISAAQFGLLPTVLPLGYAVLGTAVTVLIMKPIVGLTYVKNAWEGSFRFHHVRNREFGESIAFFNGQAAQGRESDSLFHQLYKAYLALINRVLPVAVFTSMFGAGGDIAGYAVLAIPVFGTGQLGGAPMTPDSVLTAVGIVVTLARTLNEVPTLVASLTSLGGYAHRVGHLVDSLEHLQQLYDDFESRQLVQDDPDGGVSVVGLRCRTPAGLLLFDGLTLVVPPGGRLLVMGPSGVGKSSLLRVIAGLWPFQEGTVRRPATIGRGGLFILPQRPYIAAGTLREQLTYPLAPGDAAVSDTELEALLRFVGLGHLLFVGSTPADGARTPTRASRASPFDPNDEAASLAAGNVPTVTADPAIIGHGDDVDASGVRRRRRSIYQPLLHGLLAVQAHSPSGAHSAALDAVEPWADILSVGETQRLAFVRLFVCRPQCVLMDESTSALDVAMQDRVMTECIARGITLVSVAHRPSLLRFHTQVLKLRADGGWSVQNVTDVDTGVVPLA